MAQTRKLDAGARLRGALPGRGALPPIGGLGERAGNASLEAVVVGM